MRSLLLDTEAGAAGPLIEWPAQHLVELRRAAHALEALAKRAKSAVADVAKARGPLEHPDGGTVEVVEEVRRAIEVPVAWPVLAERIDQERLLGALRIGMGDLKKAVRDGAERGAKDAAEQDLMGALDRAGALRKSSYTKVDERRSR